MWNNAISAFQNYMGEGIITIFFLAILVYLFFYEKKKPARIVFVYIPITVLILYFNPLFAEIIYRIVGDDIYYRINWILPVTIEIAYGIVTIVSRLTEKRQHIFIAVSILLIVYGGNLIYTSPFYSIAQNMYHIPRDVVEICDAIHLDGGEVVAAFPQELILYVRQYDPTVNLAFGREVFNLSEELRELLYRDEYDTIRLLQLSREKGCHYIVFQSYHTLTLPLEDFDCEKVYDNGSYVVYRDYTQELIV